MTTAEQEREILDDDARRLAELGYEQSLQRAWSGFQNFAISFTIISVLAGCFTTYGQAWNNGGPIAISWGWPIICGLILLVALSMAEIVSRYPTAGGIYWWASKMGGPTWGWFTGWFNLIGLIGIVASVNYGAATFLNALLGLYGVDFILDFSDSSGILAETWALFALILTISALINIYSSPLVARANSVSVWWHLIGVAVIVTILVLVPDKHQSVDFVFTERINNSGFSMSMFWFYVLPLGFLLTMYTQTGYDASAHISEETKGASVAAAKGVWKSVFWAGVIGWIVLLAITFAATDVAAVNEGLGSSLAIFGSALTPAAAKAVVLIATVGQLFCGMACVTSASRMTYAFSRDRAIPGHRLWTKLNHHRVPANAVLFACFWSRVVTIPAFWGDSNAFPYAFFSVVGMCVIGIYIAYAIPIYLRWKQRDTWEAGPWTLGRHYRWINPAAFIWVAICVVIFSLPFSAASVPWRDEFDWKYFNYAPVIVGATVAAVAVWWRASARRTFTGPVRTVQFDAGTGVEDERPAP